MLHISYNKNQRHPQLTLSLCNECVGECNTNVPIKAMVPSIHPDTLDLPFHPFSDICKVPLFGYTEPEDPTFA